MKNFVITMPNAVKKAINLLKQNGHQAYIVGGCVRDCIMGKEPSDWDITTSALPFEVEKALSGNTVIQTGVEHGTVTAVIDSFTIEITTFRVDGIYTDSRHPEKVEFTNSLTEDLKRRDFTMNAIAYCEDEGLIDPFGGIGDILNRVICTVGMASERFEEDALRILRALRFSSVLGFEIESVTSEEIISHKDSLLNISPERIMSELKKLLCGKNVSYILTNYKEVFFTVIPELKSCDGFEQKTKYHIHDIYTHTVFGVSQIKPDVKLRLAMLFHDIAKPMCFEVDQNGVGHFPSHAKKGAEVTNAVLKRLKFDRETTDYVTLLVKNHDIPFSCEESLLLRRLNQFGEKTVRDLILIKRADNLAKSDIVLPRQKEFDEIEKVLNDIILSKKCFSLKDLQINGNEIKSLGVSEGEKIGLILSSLLEDVMDKKIPNEKSILMREVKKLI